MAAGVGFRFPSRFWFFKIYSDIFPHIRTAMGSAPAPTSATEEIPPPEKLTKNIAEVIEDRGINSTRAPAYSGMAITIVDSALFTVRQNRIGFAAFLELFFRVRIVGIAIRME